MVELIQLEDNRYQGDCGDCGWHTRECDSKRWTYEMVDLHRKNCPARVPDSSDIPIEAERTMFIGAGPLDTKDDIPTEVVIAGVDAFHAYSRQSGYNPYPISDGQVRAILAATSEKVVES
jgi:hypothetical protein